MISLLIFSSCEKDPPVPKIVIGSLDLLDMTYYGDKNIYASYGEDSSLELDLDDDGLADLLFYVAASDSSVDKDKRGSTVSSSNDKVEICMMPSTEDLFRVRSHANDEVVEYLYNERSHFYCPECIDLGVSYQTYFTSPVIFLKKDTLSDVGQWSGNVQVLSNFDQGKVTSNQEEEFPSYNYIVTGFWNSVDNGYLIFRLKEGTRQYRYGWIKIVMNDHRGISISEKALTKEIY